MTDRNWKDITLELARKVGKPKALRELVLAGVSPGTADKLISGRYPSEPKPLLVAAIRKAIEACEKAAS